MELSIEEIQRVYVARQSSFVVAATALLKDQDAAGDVVQEGFAQALVARRKWRGGSAEAWIWKIVQRKALDQIRRRRYDVPLDKEFDSSGLLSENHSGLAEAVAATLAQARAELSEMLEKEVPS